MSFGIALLKSAGGETACDFQNMTARVAPEGHWLWARVGKMKVGM